MFDMRRREFITLLGGAAASWPLAARAQQAQRMHRVGVIAGTSGADPRLQANVAAFRDALRKYGWVEGRNLRLEYRFGDAAIGRISSDAADLVGLAPDAILVQGTAGLEALRKLTNSLPIVFVQVSDPVSAGFVQSLARPAGNITGFSNFEYAISGKWLDLLKEAAPGVNRVASLLFREDPSSPRYVAPIEAAALSSGIESTSIDLADPIQIERAIDSLARESRGG
jgi:putative ABC transport system substrate-binding protein